jgi:hypothetical protein
MILGPAALQQELEPARTSAPGRSRSRPERTGLPRRGEAVECVLLLGEAVAQVSLDPLQPAVACVVYIPAREPAVSWGSRRRRRPPGWA